jgi:hypothetical protein
LPDAPSVALYEIAAWKKLPRRVNLGSGTRFMKVDLVEEFVEELDLHSMSSENPDKSCDEHGEKASTPSCVA